MSYMLLGSNVSKNQPGQKISDSQLPSTAFFNGAAVLLIYFELVSG